MAAAVDTAVRGDAGLALAAGRIPDPPYPGIRPFEEDEWPIFFGRQAIIEELLERLSRRRFVAVVGASGGGKSSLIKAGLFATLRHKHKRLGVTWRTATMRPAGSPMWSLAEALYRTLERSPVAPDAIAPADAVEPYRAALARGPHAIAAILEEHGSPAQDNLLLLVDQFEELFRYDVLGGEAEISTFLDQLVDVIDQPPDGFYLALTMRSDFLGDCARYPRFADALNQASYLLRRMSEAEIAEAIVQPAELLDGRIEPALLDRLIRDAKGEQDHLPLLQHALMWLWARERRQLADAGAAGDKVVLDLADYDACGGMAGALSQHANAIYSGLGAPGARRGQLQVAAKRLFQALAEVGEHGRVTRRPRQFAQIAAETGVPANDLKEVIDDFRKPGRSFLMPPWPHRIDEATVIDLSHEALVRQWDQFTGAKGWLQEEQADAEVWGKLCARTKTFVDNPRRLLDADETAEFASFWKRRQPSGAWLQRYRAPEAVAVAPGRAGIAGGDRTDAVEQLLAASSRRRRLRAIAIGITAFVVALTVIGVSALTVFWQGERRQREAAETARAVAEVERARAERVAQEATAAAQQLQRLITDLQMTAAAAPVGSSFQRDIAQVQQSLEAQAGKLSSVGTRFAVVAGSDPTELGARAELAKASQPAFAGAQGVKVFRRQGTFRTVILFQDQTAAASALPSIQSRMKRPDAYVVDLDRWCPGRRDEGNDVVTCP